MENQTKFKISQFFATAFFIFWILETLYFNIEYGFHMKAINENEKICDNIALNLLGISLFFLLYIFHDFIKLYAFLNLNSIVFNLDKKKKTNTEEECLEKAKFLAVETFEEKKDTDGEILPTEYIFYNEHLIELIKYCREQ